MQRKTLIAGLIIFLTWINPGMVLCKDKNPKSWTVNSSLKALVFYFPSPSVMRCLNHSDVQRLFRRASVYRRATFPNKEVIEQNVIIGADKIHKKFIFTGNIKTKSELIPMKIKGEIPFGLAGQEFNLGLFGLENFLGLQGKVHIKDKIGNQKVDYETFLKSTKGKIGNKKYVLELHGEDQIEAGRVVGAGRDQHLQYHLTGTGMLGGYDISINAKDVEKDNYEIIENYGPVEIFTIVRVYE